jgi:hypothetical protein
VPSTRKSGSIHPLPTCLHGVVLNYRIAVNDELGKNL